VEQGSGISTATCGFPYYISSVIPRRGDLLMRGPEYFRDVMDIDVLLNTRAQRIKPSMHTIEIINLQTRKVETLQYDKLVLATGSSPAMPPLQGKDVQGVFTLSQLEDADNIKHFISQYSVRKATIIGAGFIGLEMAEALHKMGAEVHIIEALGHAMPTFLDFEIATQMGKHLLSKGVKLHFNASVIGFAADGAGKVNGVMLAKSTLETQMVLLSVGVRPNVALAKEAGLDIGERGGISVNEYLQTSHPDIYAGGDCVENIHRITGKKVLAALGSTANKHGRIIGSNITGGLETFPGVLGTGIAKVFDLTVGRTGLSEQEAMSGGYEVFNSLIEGGEYAGYYPGSRDFLVKLIADKKDGRVLGAQLVGEGDISKRLDVLVTSISLGATVDDLSHLDLAYAPPYNSAVDPVHHAANTVRNKRSGLAQSISPEELGAKIEGGDDFILLDVRSAWEWEEEHIQAGQTRRIILDGLRRELHKLPHDKEIVTICHSSVRAYQAQRILNGAGFGNVKFVDGSLVAWPYDTNKSHPDEEAVLKSDG
jgi:NADPH-dependent 2,4-dienoyl-CoA reductase/sulfur reductase-like enzyme/rhodanese-related sulfurtransferase